MNIDRPSSLFHQSLLSPVEVVEQKTVHQWNINDFVVYLIKKQDTLGYFSLEYKTIKNKKEIYVGNIEILENEEIEETISHLKTCKAIIDENGVVGFLNNYRTWTNANRESSLEEEVVKKNFKKHNVMIDENTASLVKSHLAGATTGGGIMLREYIEKKFSPENIFTSSFSNYRTWEYDSTLEISLTRGPEGLIWHIFRRITKESSFHPFQEVVIPSERCYPETIALIEKIKAEAFSNPRLLFCLISDFKVRIFDSKLFFKNSAAELARIQNDNNCYVSDELHSNFNKLKNPARVASLYLLRSAITATARSVTGFFGGGVLGTLAGGYAGLCAGGAIMGVGTVAALLSADCITSYFYKSPKDVHERHEVLQKKFHLFLSQDPLFIEIEPISAPSAIDERVRVSKFTWAVTLVTHTGLLGNHAQIIVEGINDGFYGQEFPKIGAAKAVKIGEKFIHLADFSPRIEYGLLSSDDLKYETRTEIWMRPSDQVKKMLESIEEEKYLPEDARRAFNLWGTRSKIYKFNPDIKKKFWSFSGQAGDNCFTFDREKLKMIDIEIGESYADLLVAMAKNYTRNKEEYETLPVQELI